jgi:hypothetical protein
MRFEPEFEFQVRVKQLKIPNTTATKWLNLCNFTNIKQKIDYLKQYDLGEHRDLQQMDEASAFFLQTQLEKNTKTYRELLMDHNFRGASPTNRNNKNVLQIDRDVPRTFHFTEPLEFPISHTELILVNNLDSLDMLKQALRNVLIAYSRYDKTIGYV